MGDPVITTEELHLAYRVVARLADAYSGEVIATAIFSAAAELLRVAYRSRTLHDPLPGQVSLLD